MAQRGCAVVNPTIGSSVKNLSGRRRPCWLTACAPPTHGSVVKSFATREPVARWCEHHRLHRSRPASAQSRNHCRVDYHRSDDAMSKRLVYICDWLPPDFGAVGQYAVLFAREWARDGWDVTLVGLTSGKSSRQEPEPIGDGSLEVLRMHRRTYKKQRSASRLVWTIASNVLLLSGAFRAMPRADAVLFTGSPPLMLHF